MTAQRGWNSIEWFNFGPIEQNLNYFKIYLWPDKRKSIAKQLKAIYSDPSIYPKDLATLKNQSFALQGLHTIERLLYDPTFNEQGLEKSCPLLRLIGDNLNQIIEQNNSVWQSNLTIIKSTLKKQYLSLIHI